jgi:hypothetical protein
MNGGERPNPHLVGETGLAPGLAGSAAQADEPSSGHAMPSVGEQRRARLARNEALFRNVNEQIDSLNDLGAALPSFPIVCECGAESCTESILVEKVVYEAARAHPERFLVRAGHLAEVDTAIEDHGEFLVVAKKPGLPRETAEATDPRGPTAHEAPTNVPNQIDDATARRLAENEAKFRDANERIEEAVQRLEPGALTLPFVCECGREDCLATLRVTIPEYERARRDPRYFLCSPGHEILGPGIGRVVEQTSKFVVMEKLGLAGEVAEELDPRARPDRQTATG